MKSKGEFLDTRRKEGFFEYQEEKYENKSRRHRGIDYRFSGKTGACLADHDEIVAKAAIFAAGLKEFGVPMAVTQQYTKGLGETVPAMKEAIGAFEPMEKTAFSAMGCDAFVEWVKAQGKRQFWFAAWKHISACCRVL